MCSTSNSTEDIHEIILFDNPYQFELFLFGYYRVIQQNDYIIPLQIIELTKNFGQITLFQYFEYY